MSYTIALSIGPDALFLESYCRAKVSTTRADIDYMALHLPRIPLVLRQYLVVPFAVAFVNFAFFRNNGLCRRVIAIMLPWLLRLHIATPSMAVPSIHFMIGDANGFFRTLRRHSTANIHTLVCFFFLPTEEARRIRTHKKFPKIAEEIGLVKAWQTYGWPPQFQPKPGTDGSNLQFTCTG